MTCTSPAANQGLKSNHDPARLSALTFEKKTGSGSDLRENNQIISDTSKKPNSDRI